jgi:hypothetical protein
MSCGNLKSNRESQITQLSKGLYNSSLTYKEGGDGQTACTYTVDGYYS